MRTGIWTSRHVQPLARDALRAMCAVARDGLVRYYCTTLTLTTLTLTYYLRLIEHYQSQNEPLDVPGRQIGGQDRILRQKMGLETLG